MQKKISTIKVLSVFLVAAAILTFAMPRRANFSFDYKVGSEWKYPDLYSDINFPILKTDEQIREELASTASAVIPYYRFSSEVTDLNVRAVETMELGDLRMVVADAVRDIYSKGVTSDEGIKWSGEGAAPSVIYIQKDKRASKHPAAEVRRLTEARAALLSAVSAAVPGINVDSILLARGVYDLLVPNLSYDSQTTALVNAETRSSLSPTAGYVSNGQLLVKGGEIVTPEIAQMLDSDKSELSTREFRGSQFYVWLGNALIAIIILALLYLSIYFTKRHILADSRFLYVITVFLLMSVGALVAIRFDESVLPLIPFTLGALYLQAFFRNKFIIPVYAVSLLPLLIFSGNGVVYFVMYLLAGLVATFAFQWLGKGWKQFVLALIIFFVLLFTYSSFSLVHFAETTVLPRFVLRLFLGAMLTVAGYPLVYLFEKLFNLVSSSRLADLCDTSNPLLRELEKKAPGTFQHSLQVMNMADAVARAIDSNPLLVRAGALYHDIGKTVNPQCFVENESLLAKAPEDKYHFGLTPQQSAHDIIKHTTDGVDIAVKAKLPEIIVDFIRTHHGTTLVGYFYGQALKSGEPVQETEFRYPGMRPTSKEQIILMLCDSIEAASRSLESYTPEAFSEFVEKIVKGKMEDGQFDDSTISVKEIGQVKEAIKSYLAQTHHERIAYPDRKNKKSNK